jgi:hypothetical protein
VKQPHFLEQTATSIRFQVDDVVPITDRLPKESLHTHLQGRLQNPLIAHSHPDHAEVLSGETVHPLAAAVHLAFSHHRPLILTPDIIWLTIAQGFSHHINHHAEEFRDRFVQHQGKLKLEVRTQSTAIEDWQKAINDWTLQIRDHVGTDLHRQIICNFSTTTPITQTASQIVLMDSFKQYFDYVLFGICGIPWIELQGTTGDWEEIRDRVKFIAQYDLDWWCDRLLPICEAFISTAQGDPQQAFWQQIYKPQGVYGGDMITGWLGDLFPYLKSEISRLPVERNPMLAVPRSKIIDSQSNPQGQIHGLHSSQIPIGLSQVQFTMFTTTSQQTLNLFAGFVGLQQSETGAVYPEIGWGICEPDEFTQLLDRLAEKHSTQTGLIWAALVGMDGVPKEMFQLLDRFNGITLFPNTDHSWQIIDAAMLHFLHKYDLIDGQTDLEATSPIATLTPCMRLNDGRCVAIATHYTPEGIVYWIVVGQPIDRPEFVEDQDHLPFVRQQYFLMQDTMAIAKGLPQLLERILESDGQYYFDNPSFHGEIDIAEIFA